MRAFFKCLCVSAVWLVPCACSTSTQPGLSSADPQGRIQAVVRAAREEDRSAVPMLIDLLDDDDPAVRFFTILALEKITGTRRDYDYAAPAWERAVAVRRWRTWMEEKVQAGEAGHWTAEASETGTQEESG